MRNKVHRNFQLGTLSIADVKVDEKSRHQLPKLLKALQYIYSNDDLRKPILDIIEKKVTGKLKNSKTGRAGMSYWEIFVFAVVRLNLNIDYDYLQDLCNNHNNLRGIAGVLNVSDFNSSLVYQLQTLKDNVGLLDETCIQEISEIVVKAGHQIIKKKQEEEGLTEPDTDYALNAKVDSFVVLSNVHFPTDINLLWDCLRKILDSIASIVSDTHIAGFRQHRGLRKKARNAYRQTSEIHRKKGSNYTVRLKASCTNYLDLADDLVSKLQAAQPDLMVYAASDIKHRIKVEQLYYYWKLLNKHIDLVRRRIINGEEIPHCDKMFSIFETYTEWLYKGKAGGLVELGLNVNVATCQHHFILHHQVMEKQVDVNMTLPTAQGIQTKYSPSAGYHLSQISYDTSYYSKPNKESVGSIFDTVIMPKKGKRNEVEKQLESEENFKAGRRKHSAIESNINSLEHHGLDRCPDRSLAHFKRYVALGVLSYNLTLLGGLL